jgi:hypothetical protein
MRAAALLLALAACKPQFQMVRMDIPVGAQVHIDAGFGTPTVDFATPFVGRFEIGSLVEGGGIPMVFSLDDNAAKRYGGEHAVKIYARLSIGDQTDFSRTQTLRLAPEEDRLRALVRGEISEYSTFVSDPSANQRLCQVTLRMAPF